MTYTCTHAHTHMHTHTCTHVHTHMHTCAHTHMHTCAHAHAHTCTQVQELVVVVGRPASGKSTIREKFFVPNGYVAVNRDTMGTQSKCLKVAKEALASGKSVIVDNTNPSKAVRKPYIDLAKQFGVAARCLHLTVAPDVCNHLNYYRQIQTQGARRRVPDVGVRVYEKDFQAPTVGEGFTEVKELGFVPKFDSVADEELFKQWSH